MPTVAWPRESAPTTHDYLVSIDRIMPPTQFSLSSPYLLLGHVFQAAPLPRGVEMGEPRQCYRNAAQLAMEKPGLAYCEGYATVPGMGLPVHHAWCVDEGGRVLEVTWEPPKDGAPVSEYVGMAYRTDFLLEYLQRTGVWGMTGEFMPSFILEENPEAFLHPDWLPADHHYRVFRERLEPLVARAQEIDALLASEARKQG